MPRNVGASTEKNLKEEKELQKAGSKVVWQALWFTMTTVNTNNLQANHKTSILKVEANSVEEEEWDSVDLNLATGKS